MAGRNSFVFYHDFAEYIAELSGDEVKELLVAVVDYDRDGVIPSITGPVKMAFIAIRIKIDKDRDNWENTCKKRRKAGRMGGAPSGNENAKTGKGKQKQAKQANGYFDKQKQAKQAKQADYDCDCDCDNDCEDQKTKNSCSLPEKPATERKPSRLDIAFDDFWASYPRKVGKGAAKKSWDKIRPSPELHGKILAAVAAAKKSKQWAEDIKYIPHPSTWLNQERWEDEILSDGIPPEDAERQRTLEAWLKEDSNG